MPRSQSGAVAGTAASIKSNHQSGRGVASTPAASRSSLNSLTIGPRATSSFDSVLK